MPAEDFSSFPREQLIKRCREQSRLLASQKMIIQRYQNAQKIKADLDALNAHRIFDNNLKNLNQNVSLITEVRMVAESLRTMNLRIPGSPVSLDHLPAPDADEAALSSWIKALAVECRALTTNNRQLNSAVFATSQSEQRRYCTGHNNRGGLSDNEEAVKPKPQQRPPMTIAEKLNNERRLFNESLEHAADSMEKSDKFSRKAEDQLHTAQYHSNHIDKLQAKLVKDRAETAADPAPALDPELTPEPKPNPDENSDHGEFKPDNNSTVNSGGPDNGDDNDNSGIPDINDNPDIDDFDDDIPHHDDGDSDGKDNITDNELSSLLSGQDGKPDSSDTDEHAEDGKETRQAQKQKTLKRGRAALNEIEEDGFAVVPDPDSQICPHCGSKEQQKLLSCQQRISQACSSVQIRAQEVQTMSQSMECSGCGLHYEVNGASASSICAINKEQARVMELNDVFGNPHHDHKKVPESVCPQSPEDLSKKEELCEHYGCSEWLRPLLVCIDGELFLDPYLYFISCAVLLYGIRPMLVGGTFSLGTIAFMIALFVDAWISKLRAIELTNSFAGRELLSDKQSVIVMNKMGRMFFHNPAQEILFNILTRCKVVHMDETCLQVAVMPNETNYLWVITSGPNEEYQGCVYIVSNDRSHENIIKLLNGDKSILGGFADGRKFELSVEVIVCDCFAGCDTAVRKYNEGRDEEHQIVLARCLQHANRLVVKSLDSMGLGKIYLEISETDFAKFPEKLKVHAKEHGLNRIDVIMLLIRFYIEALYRLERFMAKEDLEGEDVARQMKIKQELCRNFMNKIFDLAREAAGTVKTVKHSVRNGRDHYEYDAKVYTGTWLQAACYLLNAEPDFMTFTKRTDVPLTNNKAERMIRKPVWQRSNMITGFRSTDGAMAFADMRSVAETCRMNGINFHEYEHWMLQSTKMRVDEYRLDSRNPCQILKLIKDMKYEDERQPSPEERAHRLMLGNAYNPDNRCVTDRISCRRLEPVFYKRLKELCTPREPSPTQGPPPQAAP